MSMIPSYLNPSHVSEEYELRLHARPRNLDVRNDPRQSMMRQQLGRLIIGLGELVHRRRPSAISEPGAGRWVTKGG